MARAIRETPVLYGKDAERFEKEIRETQPLSEERKSEMREQYKSFMRKVNIKVEKKRCADLNGFLLNDAKSFIRPLK